MLTHRGTLTGHANAVRNFTVTRHSSSAAGDVLVVFCGYVARWNATTSAYEYFRTITPPAGWTLLQQDYRGTSPELGQELYAFSRVVQAGDALTYLFAVSNPADISWQCVAYTAQDGSTPVNVSAMTDTGAGTSLVAPSVTTSAANTVLLTAWQLPYTATITLPGGMTQRGRVDGETYSAELGFSLVVASESVAATGATGTRTATAGASVANNLGISVALAPDTTVRSATLKKADSGSALGIPRFSTPSNQSEMDVLLEETSTAGWDDVRFFWEFEPFISDSGETATVRFSTHEFTTSPSASPANKRFMERVVDPVSLTRSIFQGNALGGPGQSDLGSVVLMHNDGRLEYLDDYRWDGAVAVLKAYGFRFNGEEVAYENAKTILRARTTDCDVQVRDVTITLEDYGAILDREVQQSFFSGTGGNEGGDDLKGKPKPLLLGVVFHARPILVDHQGPTYMLSSAGLSEVSAVFVGGYELDPSEYTVDLVNGTITLLVSPFGEVTCHAIGPEAAGTTAASIVKWLTSDAGIGPLLYPNDFETDSYLAFDAAQPYDCGIYLDQAMQIPDAVSYLMAPTGFFVMTMTGKLRLGKVKVPIGETVADFKAYEIRGVPRRVKTERPWYRYPLGYARAWTTLSGTELFEGVLGTDGEQFITNEWRIAPFTDDDVKLAHPRSKPPERIDSPLAEKDDAQAVADENGLIYSKRWDVFEVDLPLRAITVDLGDLVSITYNGLGLSNGRTFMVLGGQVGRRGVTLTLWRTKVEQVLGFEDGFAMEDESGTYVLGI